MKETLKGYKVFNPDWTCRSFKYEVGKEYKSDEQPICCETGFHFCTIASDCFSYYSFDSSNHIALVEALGDIDKAEDDSKVSTNHIHIIEEISWEKLLIIINTGKNNSGYRNSGHSNSGNSNSGNWNSGNSNSGYRNSGNSNSGNSNSGNSNSGNWNSGYSNSGNSNSGYSNSGYWNSGNWNSGYWNSGNWNSGYFNTLSSTVKMFDVETNLSYEECEKTKWFQILTSKSFSLIKWISWNDMSDEEKKLYEKAYVTEGYLRTQTYKAAWEEMWESFTEEEKQTIITTLPNFDKDKFEQITGIKL